MTKNEKITVLCVEDESDIRENIIEILKDEGFEVFGAENGNKALDLFNHNDIDVIISDIMMPDCDGYEFLKSVRNSDYEKKKNVPFILLTALASKEQFIKGISLAANDYIVKPIDFDILIAKIKEKTHNAKRVKDSHGSDIENIKLQIANMIPSEFMDNVQSIIDVSSDLKSEPYGPFPHKRYLSDISKINIISTKLGVLVSNFLNKDTIMNNIDLNDRIENIEDVIKNFTSHLSDKLKSIVKFNIYEDNIPTAKINKSLILSSIKKILLNFIKINQNGVDIGVITDNLGQIVIVISLKDEITDKNADDIIKKDKEIQDKLIDDGYDFRIIFKNHELSTLIYIPQYRIIH